MSGSGAAAGAADAASGAAAVGAEAGAQAAAEATPVATAAATADDVLIEDEAPPLVIRRRGRRVTTEPSPGYKGEPAVERHQSSENDARLRGDVPPHWG